MNGINISQFDIARLMSEPSPTVRADVAGKIARDYNHGHFQAREAELALDILKLLAKDPESRVRRVMAEKLKSNHTLPRELVLAFANDVADVALPVLEYSFALTEEDLIEIVHSSKSFAKRSAIARRETISAALAEALIGTANEQIIRIVCANSGASLSEEPLMKILAGFGSELPILEALAMRSDLPYQVANQLFSRVRDELKTHLAQQYKLSTRVAEEETSEAQEYIDILNASIEHAAQGIEESYAAEELTDSLIIRALCEGDTLFFESAVAKRADVHPLNARMLMLDPSGRGFSALYDAANLPPGFFDAIYTLYHAILEETGYGRFTRGDQKKRILTRLVREGHDHQIEHMAYLMSLIGVAREEMIAA